MKTKPSVIAKVIDHGIGDYEIKFTQKPKKQRKVIALKAFAVLDKKGKFLLAWRSLGGAKRYSVSVETKPVACQITFEKPTKSRRTK